jgi:hypothetical protein
MTAKNTGSYTVEVFFAYVDAKNKKGEETKRRILIRRMNVLIKWEELASGIKYDNYKVNRISRDMGRLVFYSVSKLANVDQPWWIKTPHKQKWVREGKSLDAESFLYWLNAKIGSQTAAAFEELETKMPEKKAA